MMMVMVTQMTSMVMIFAIMILIRGMIITMVHIVQVLLGQLAITQQE